MKSEGTKVFTVYPERDKKCIGLTGCSLVTLLLCYCLLSCSLRVRGFGMYDKSNSFYDMRHQLQILSNGYHSVLQETLEP